MNPRDWSEMHVSSAHEPAYKAMFGASDHVRYFRPCSVVYKTMLCALGHVWRSTGQCSGSGRHLRCPTRPCSGSGKHVRLSARPRLGYTRHFGAPGHVQVLQGMFGALQSHVRCSGPCSLLCKPIFGVLQGHIRALGHVWCSRPCWVLYKVMFGALQSHVRCSRPCSVSYKAIFGL